MQGPLRPRRAGYFHALYWQFAHTIFAALPPPLPLRGADEQPREKSHRRALAIKVNANSHSPEQPSNPTRITPSSVAPPQGNATANPGKRPTNESEPCHGVNCNEMLCCRVIESAVARRPSVRAVTHGRYALHSVRRSRRGGSRTEFRCLFRLQASS